MSTVELERPLDRRRRAVVRAYVPETSRVALPRAGAESVNSASSATHSMPPVMVPEDGRIRVPYAGTIQVGGMTARQIGHGFGKQLQ